MDDATLHAMRTLSTAVQLLALAAQPVGVTRPPVCPVCHHEEVCEDGCDLATLLLWPTPSTELARRAAPDSVIQNGPEPDSV